MAATWTQPEVYVAKAVEALTEAAPTLATEGVNLNFSTGVTIILEAEATRTLSGAGTLAAYIYDTMVAGWVRVPSLDITVPAGASGNRRCAFVPTLTIRRGRLAYIATGVTVSGGTTCTVYHIVSPKI